MRILVTGGAGFIGSHTADRLLALGHDVMVLDALTQPVHPGGRRRAYLQPGGRLLPGRRPQPRTLANLLRRVDAVYHLAAYQDYLTGLRPLFRRQRRLHRPDLRDHRGRAAGPGAGGGGVLAVGHGRGALPVPGRRRAAPRHAPRGRPGRRPVGHPLPANAAVRWRCGPRRSASPIRRTPTGCRSTARRWSPSTSAAATASRPSRSATASSRVPGSPSTTPTRALAASSASTTCRAGADRCTRTAEPSATTSTSTTSWTPTCSCCKTTAPQGGSSTSAGARRSRPRSSPTSSCANTARTSPAWSPASTASATPGTSCPTSPPCSALGWEPQRTPADSVAAYAAWLEGIGGPRWRPGRGQRPDARARRRPEGRRMKAFLLAAGVGTRLRPITDTMPKCMLRSTAAPARHLARRLRPGRRRRGSRQPAPPRRMSSRAHLAARTAPPVVHTVFEPELLGSAGTLLSQPGMGGRTRSSSSPATRTT